MILLSEKGGPFHAGYYKENKTGSSKGRHPESIGACNKDRGEKQAPPGKGDDSMSMEQNKRHTFDAYCKRLVKNEAVNIHLEYARQGKREAVFSELTQRELQSLCCTDRYAPERRVFTVLDMDFEIEDADLVRALAALTLERRSIVLLAYLLEMKDDEIAQRLQMNRSTVQYQRTNTLEELRKLMEGYEYE